MELQKVVQINFKDSNEREVQVNDTVIYISNGTDASSVATFLGFSKRGALILQNILNGKTYNVMPQTIKKLVVVDEISID